MRKNILNKRGNFLDIPFIIVVVFVAGIVAVAVGVGLGNIADVFSQDPNFSGGNATVQNAYEDYFPLWDGIFVSILVLANLAVLISAFFIRSHPFFFVVFLLALIVFVIIAAQIQSTWEDISSAPELSAAASNFTMTSFFMTKLPIFTIVFSILVALVMLGTKSRT